MIIRNKLRFYKQWSHVRLEQKMLGEFNMVQGLARAVAGRFAHSLPLGLAAELAQPVLELVWRYYCLYRDGDGPGGQADVVLSRSPQEPWLAAAVASIRRRLGRAEDGVYLLSRDTALRVRGEFVANYLRPDFTLRRLQNGDLEVMVRGRAVGVMERLDAGPRRRRSEQKPSVILDASGRPGDVRAAYVYPLSKARVQRQARSSTRMSSSDDSVMYVCSASARSMVAMSGPLSELSELSAVSRR